MKILLISDTHGDTALLANEILPKYAHEVQMAIHLGDFAHDLLDMQCTYPNLPMVGVGGAFEMKEKSERIITVGDGKHRILLTHGHMFNVKFGLDRLVYYAQEKGVDACFFGHTHTATQFVLTPRQSFALQNFATPLGKGVTPPSQANDLIGGVIKNGIFFMNPGSVTEPRAAANGSFGIVTISLEGEFTADVINV